MVNFLKCFGGTSYYHIQSQSARLNTKAVLDTTFHYAVSRTAFLAPCRELYALLSQCVTGGFTAVLVVALPQLSHSTYDIALKISCGNFPSTIISTGALRGYCLSAKGRRPPLPPQKPQLFYQSSHFCKLAPFFPFHTTAIICFCFSFIK